MPRPALVLACLAALIAVPATAKTACSDVALVLAIDTSGSISEAENALQIAGYAGAFLNPKVQNALAASGVVDLSAVFWSDADFASVTIPWQRVRSAADAERFAASLTADAVRGFGDTNIGAGLDTALDLLDQPGLCTARRVINISGDGRESQLQSRRSSGNRTALATARARAKDMGVTINGLAILRDDATLDAYYREKIATGPGAFVMNVNGFDDFADAIAEKLIREVRLPLTAALDPAALR